MKKLIMLGGSFFQIPAIKKAKEMGFYTIVCDYLPDNPGQHYADKYYDISTTDKDAVLEIAKKEKINGIVCYASDPAAPTAAYVAEKLNLAGHPYKSVEILSNKDLFRTFLKDNGFNTPRANGFKNINEAKKDFNNFKMPVMVKPVDSSGSKGITKIDNISELEKAFEYAMSFSRIKRVIIEEYVESYTHSINGDGFSIDGKLVFSAFAGQYFSPKAENPFTPVASIWPNMMPKHLHQKLRNEIQKVLNLLNMKTGSYNFEARISKDEQVYLMEIGTRNGGNCGPQAIYESTGVDLVEYTIKAALNEDCCDLNSEHSSKCTAYYVVHSLKNGVLKDIQIDPEFEKEHIINFYPIKKVGEKVTTLKGSNATVGIMILKFNNPKEAFDLMEKMYELVKLVVE